MKKTIKKVIPIFQSEAEERAFWLVNDSADYADWKNAAKATMLPNLKLSAQEHMPKVDALNQK